MSGVSPLLGNIVWRGLTIETTECTFSGGGRVFSQHFYFGADYPYLEDTGAAAQVIGVRGFIGGSAMIPEVLVLKSLMQTKTSSLLVHPVLGPMTVILNRSSVNYGLDGICYVDFEFIRVDPNQGQSLFPQALINTASALLSSATDALDGFAGDFLESAGTVLALGSYAASTLLGGVSLVTGTLSGLVSSAQIAPGLVRGFEFSLPQTVTVAASQKSQLTQAPAVLSQLPSGLTTSQTSQQAQALLLAQALSNQASFTTQSATTTAIAQTITAATLSQLSQAISDQVTAFSTAIQDPVDNIQATQTAITALQGQVGGQETVCSYARALLVASLATSTASLQITSSTQASQTQTSLVGLIDQEVDQASTLGNNSTAVALRSVRATLSSDLTARGSGLPGLTQYSTLVSLPSFVLAHKIYGDAKRFSEIELRNPVANPLFMPLTLEVLND